MKKTIADFMKEELIKDYGKDYEDIMLINRGNLDVCHEGYDKWLKYSGRKKRKHIAIFLADILYSAMNSKRGKELFEYYGTIHYKGIIKKPVGCWKLREVELSILKEVQ